MQWYREEVLVHEAALRVYLKKAFPSVPEVEDVVQEALGRVLQAKREGDVPAPRAFLFATARNVAVDCLHRRNIAAIGGLDTRGLAVLAEARSARDVDADGPGREVLIEAMQALPEQSRRVLTLRKIYGLSQREAAAKLGISEENVEAQVADGVRRCAGFLLRKGSFGATPAQSRDPMGASARGGRSGSELDTAAAQWLARRDRGLSFSEAADFAAWTSASPAHEAALLRIERTWGALDALSALRPQLPLEADPEFLRPAPQRRLAGWSARRWSAVAAALLLALALGGWWWDARRVSGTDRRIEFVEAPLAQVVKEFNRHHVRQLALADEATAQVRVGGIFILDDEEAFLRQLGENYGVVADRHDPAATVLRKRP